MIWGAISVGLTVLGLVSAGVGIYDAISTGSWREWGVLDWLFNIAVCTLSIFPFFTAFRSASAASAVTRGGILARLENVPFIGKIVTWIWAITTTFKTIWSVVMAPLFREGGFLYKFGKAITSNGKILKHPWVLFGLLLGSTFFDGILKTIFQGWNHLAMKAANLSFEVIGDIMDEDGIDPIHDITVILVEGKSNLPECFTAIWGAVGAGDCFGLIMTTFQYAFLVTALRNGFRLYGRGN